MRTTWVQTSASSCHATFLHLVTMLGLAALLCLAAPAPGNAQNEQRFLFIGDLPYSDEQNDRLNDIIAPAISKGGFPFLVHYGDFKGSGVSCSEALIRSAHKQITGLMANGSQTTSSAPVFYTPGDNEWTDCDRWFGDSDAGRPTSELGRLDLLRRVFFFENPVKLPDTWQNERQPLYPENALWRFGKVQFATVHLVGTNNGRLEILKDDVAMALAHVDARDQANRAWLNDIFWKASAFRNLADAVIITTQADVTNPDEYAPCTPTNRMNCDAFADFRSQLIKHAAAFNGPVLLVHGDTGPYCLDKNFGGSEASNIWRLNAGGDYHQPLDATVVTYRPRATNDPFSVRGLVEGERPAEHC